MRYNFNQLFRENPDGSLTPRFNIKIGGVTFGPSITFTKGVSFSGINVFDFKGSDIEVEQEGDVLVIKGFYR